MLPPLDFSWMQILWQRGLVGHPNQNVRSPTAAPLAPVPYNYVVLFTLN